MPDKQCFKFLLFIVVLLSGFRVRKLHIVLIANCCISHCHAGYFLCTTPQFSILFICNIPVVNLNFHSEKKTALTLDQMAWSDAN